MSLSLRERRAVVKEISVRYKKVKKKEKGKILDEFVDWDRKNVKSTTYKFCQGIRKIRKPKPQDADESNNEKLDTRLLDNHYDSYWQICKSLGCTRKPAPDEQVELEFIEEEE